MQVSPQSSNGELSYFSNVAHLHAQAADAAHVKAKPADLQWLPYASLSQAFAQAGLPPPPRARYVAPGGANRWPECAGFLRLHAGSCLVLVLVVDDYQT